MNWEGRAGKSLYTGCVSPCRTGRNCAFAIFCVYNNGTSFEDKRKIGEQRKKRAHTQKKKYCRRGLFTGQLLLRRSLSGARKTPGEKMHILPSFAWGRIYTRRVPPARQENENCISLAPFPLRVCACLRRVFCRSLESSGTGQIWCGAWTYIADRDQAY